MTPEQQKEELSRAYLHAVAARCGFAVGSWSQDQWGIDVTIGAAGPVGGGSLSCPKLDVQLKCTSKPEHLSNDHVRWQISRQHYDRLRARKSVPQILVVLVLPEEQETWVEHTTDALILRRCAWWVKMRDMPAHDGESTVVHLPLQQVFSPEQLQVLMERLSREESI